MKGKEREGKESGNKGGLWEDIRIKVGHMEEGSKEKAKKEEGRR